MNEIALIIIVIQQWIEDAVLLFENLFCLPRTEADRPHGDLSIVDPASGLLFHGAVFMDVGQHAWRQALVGSSLSNRLIGERGTIEGRASSAHP